MKHRLQGLLLGIVLILCIGAARQAPKHWKDVLLRVDQQWFNAYGDYPESALAYNVLRQQQIIQAQGVAIQDHEARLKALEAVVDPNSEEPNGTE